MNKQIIAVTWEMCGYIEVEANSVEEAMNKVMENPDDFSLPVRQDYVDGSFWVSTEDVNEMKVICNVNTSIKEAVFISVWDGDRIETICKVNTDTKEIFDIEQSNYTPDGICEGEYVEINGEEHEVVVYDDAGAGEYWRY